MFFLAAVWMSSEGHRIIVQRKKISSNARSFSPYAASAAWKAALRCCIWYWSKTAEARRKPVLTNRFHLTHPRPAKPYPLSAMMK
ncbi:hypothetical protein EC960497_A0091 [Escherichia coli 96.0497]|nr:hypothetical protein EC960497_A0091 [Escherichia coli 96.0497]